jgi:hypothetical protein
MADAPAAGSSDDLVFAITGDTRPAVPDDTANYPTAIIDQIFLDAGSAGAQFVIGTGDYQFTAFATQAAQLGDYMTARMGYAGPFYPAMGNHECNGLAASNCGSGNADGVTTNMSLWMSMFLTPINQSLPYYVENVAASDNSWTAKFVIMACNAWTTDQQTWLGSALAVPTTYTFVVRHEAVEDLSGTPCSASQTAIDANPLTLLIVGHTHEYAHEGSNKEIINGIGGAPLDSGTNYGYTLVSRNSDGTLTVGTFDYETGSAIDSFMIDANGSGV